MRLSANFVMTVDGKVQGPGAGYWPIGSAADLALLLKLRAQCDVLVHGRLTAMGHEHIKRLASPDFQRLLSEHGHKQPYAYVVLSAHPDLLLLDKIQPGESGLQVILATTQDAVLDFVVPKGIDVWRCGSGEVDLSVLVVRMEQQGWRRAALEAGPRLFGAFVAAELADDLYLTIAPKLFGTAFGTPTMINGILFAPEKVPRLELVTHEAVGDELNLHYRFINKRP